MIVTITLGATVYDVFPLLQTADDGLNHGVQSIFFGEPLSANTRKIVITLAIIVIISTIGFLVYNTYLKPPQPTPVTQIGSYIVMMTDPPHPLDGTTMLGGTIRELSLYITFPNGTSRWVPAAPDFELDMLAIVNKKQTVASVAMPYGSVVKQVRFNITKLSNTVKGQAHDLTALCRQLQVSVRGSEPLNQSRSGVLIDLHPSVFLIQLANTTVGTASSYILAPDMAAIYQKNIGENQSTVGSWTFLTGSDVDEVNTASREVAGSITLTSATLRVTGVQTSLRLSLKNVGLTNTTIFGVVLNGVYNVSVQEGAGFSATAPFRIRGSSLSPIFNEDASSSPPLVLRPSGEAVLEFNGEIRGSLTISTGGSSLVTFNPVAGKIFIFRVISEASNQDLRYQIFAEGS
jgi:hypothetical protein